MADRTDPIALAPFGAGIPAPALAAAPQTGEHPSWGWVLGRACLIVMRSTSGPDHAWLRKLVAPSFPHRRAEAMRARVEAVTAKPLDAAASGADRQVVDVRQTSRIGCRCGSSANFPAYPTS
ncbi:hypothetical protein [Streptomyces brasiliensis]|uniref:hypothetical protein n=1 Tax=Streptomyces brasiliensis TaxID=1954 RepID=UPI0016715DF5|nr:hypothetical protein [Streptomyces brasiliensis]